MVIDPYNVDIMTLPSLALEQRNLLPDVVAIYLVYAPGPDILYIGRAKALLSRWRAHHRLIQLQSLKNIRIAWLVVSDVAFLSEIEKALILHFQPRYNGSTYPKADTGYETVTIRLPQNIMDYFRERAARERRSFNAELLVFIEHCMKQESREKETHEPAYS